jgi:crossover junction endodeoxyribonuclease RuvC
MARRFVGIDPGSTGAVVILDERGSIELASLMPIRKVGKRSEVDAAALAAMVASDQETRACVENVTAFGMGRTSAFTFGKNLGAVHAVLDVLNIPTMRVLPRLWQEVFWCRQNVEDTKTAAVACVLDRWPQMASALKLKKHQGIADAVLIAEWLRLTVG